jgi:hypothetical protein
MVTVTAAAPAAWAPTNKSGLVLYLRSDTGTYDSGSTPCIQDGFVQHWADQSGNGYNVTNGGALKTIPSFKTNIFGSFPGVQFVAASGAAMHVPSNVGGTFSGTDLDWGIAVVLKPTSTNSTRAIITFSGADADALLEMNLNSAYFQQIHRDNGATLKQHNSDYTASANNVSHAVVYNCNGTQANTYRNGSLTGSANGDLDVGVTSLGTPAYLGWRANGSTQYFDGYLGVVLVYDSPLSAEDIAGFTAWAAATFGTPSS